MYTIVGLGNPGPEYEMTRHNAGRIVLTHFLETHGFPSMVTSSALGGRVSEHLVDNVDVRVLFPRTYMNESGGAVKKALASEGSLSELIVVHDELDLPHGSFKISKGSGSGGHKGVESVIRSLGANTFVRVRVGIAPVSFLGTMKKPHGEDRVSRFVLGTFSKKELATLASIGPQVSQALAIILTKGAEAAMNAMN